MGKTKFIPIVMLLILLFAMVPFSYAANETEIVDLGDGFTGIITSSVISTSSFRAREQSTSMRKEMIIRYSGKQIGTFYLTGTFTYNGSSAKATSDDWDALTASGYDCDGQSSRSGATVKGSCTFSGNGINKTVSLKITCDKDGNLS